VPIGLSHVWKAMCVLLEQMLWVMKKCGHAGKPASASGW